MTTADRVDDPDADTFEDDHHLAARLAAEAGTLLLATRLELEAGGWPSWRIMDEGDLRSHHFLADALAVARPDDAVLSEEGRDTRARLAADRVWIVDPLDGTNEFGEPGRSDWAVHVALVSGDGRLLAGAVSLPAHSIVLSTDPAPLLPALDRDRPRVITSRWHTPYVAMLIGEALGADVVRLGSAGAKAMAVVLGHADVYAHGGGMYEWDTAAPAAVAVAAGLHVSRLDGSPLVYNRSDPWMPDFVICRPELAEAALAAVQR